jgi:uncharacterized cupredoxin-like copper-binding protein
MVGTRRIAVVAGALAVLALGACGGDNEPAEPAAGGTTSVDVTLKEWSVAPSRGAAAAGSITFTVKNDGPDHEHELVVVKTDLAPIALPTKPDGTVDESGAGLTAIGEIEQFAVGKTETKTFDLTAGKYALFCNVLEEEAMANMAGIKAHFKLGMFAAFTVT